MHSCQSILLTNDDGKDSPFLEALQLEFVQAKWVNEIRTVVPAQEQSWVAQSMSRNSPVFVSEFCLTAGTSFATSGTPADCVSLGIHNLFQNPPSLVVSGVNIGTNAGLAFYLCSGTVAAARQAFLSGVPAIAISASAPLEVFQLWNQHELGLLAAFRESFQRLASVAVSLCETLFQITDWQQVDLYSINLPWEAALDTEAVITKLESTFYPQLFQKRDNGEYIHQPQGLPFSKSSSNSQPLATDTHTMAEGKISISPISYRLIGIDAEYCSTLQGKIASRLL